MCERGADVNRGQRSSSLHYAACFGRPQVAKVTKTQTHLSALNFQLLFPTTVLFIQLRLVLIVTLVTEQCANAVLTSGFFIDI